MLGRQERRSRIPNSRPPRSTLSPQIMELKRQAPTSIWLNATWSCSAAAMSCTSSSPTTTLTGRVTLRKGWLARPIYGRLSDLRPKLLERQQKGAAIAVTMAESDGRGRKSANMLRPRAVWIEADGPLRRDLPLLPSITLETSPGKRHYIYVVRDLGWPLWHGVQQAFISEYGSDPQAA